VGTDIARHSHSAEAAAYVAQAAAESHSAEPSAPASWEAVAGESASSARGALFLPYEIKELLLLLIIYILDKQ
jgi:hypothetical protein